MTRKASAMFMRKITNELVPLKNLQLEGFGRMSPMLHIDISNKSADAFSTALPTSIKKPHLEWIAKIFNAGIYFLTLRNAFYYLFAMLCEFIINTSPRHRRGIMNESRHLSQVNLFTNTWWVHRQSRICQDIANRRMFCETFTMFSQAHRRCFHQFISFASEIHCRYNEKKKLWDLFMIRAYAGSSWSI